MVPVGTLHGGVGKDLKTSAPNYMAFDINTMHAQELSHNFAFGDMLGLPGSGG